MSSTPVAPVFAEEPSAPDAVAPSEDAVELGDEAPEPVGPEEVPLSQVDEATGLEAEPQDDLAPADEAVEDAAGEAEQASDDLPAEPGRYDDEGSDETLDARGSDAILTAQAESYTTTLHYDVTFGQSEARKLHKMVNDFRGGYGRGKLSYDYDLERAAMQRAAEVAIVFSHKRPDGDRYSAIPGSSFSYRSENIVMYKDTVDQAMERWKGSSVHHENMLDGNYNVMAAAFVKLNGMTFWVQEFGYRAKPNTKQTTANNSKTGVTVSILDRFVRGTVKCSASPSLVWLDKAGDTAALPQAAASGLKLHNDATGDTTQGIDSFSGKADATWSSSNTAVAKVQGGKLVAVGKGTCALSATVFGKSVSATVHVGNKPTWTGATRMPVGAKAAYTCSKGSWIRLMKNGKRVTDDGVVSISGKTITAKKPGTTTVYLTDDAGNEIMHKTITVYDISSGNWELQSPIDSHYVLDIKYRSKANAARMIVWKRNNQTNQRYRFEPMGDGSYLMKCVHSGKCVDVQYGGTAKQQPVIQWSRNARDNQRWELKVDKNNYVTFICKKSGMCFDIQYGKVSNGAAMIQWPSNGRDNQKWVLNKK